MWKDHHLQVKIGLYCPQSDISENDVEPPYESKRDTLHTSLVKKEFCFQKLALGKRAFGFSRGTITGQD